MRIANILNHEHFADRFGLFADPAGVPAGGGTPPPEKKPETKFELPTELQGKGPEDVARYYSDRYKDYDDYKTRASSWDKIKKKPEEVEADLTLTEKIRERLGRGEEIYVKDGQIFSRPPQVAGKQPTEQERRKEPSADAGNDDWLNDWETSDARDQARRMSTYVTKTMNGVIEAKEGEFRKLFDQAQSVTFRQLDAVLNLIVQAQEHPELKVKDVMVRAAKIAQENPNVDPMKAAIDEFLTPASIETRAQALAAEQIAKDRAEVERKNAERRLAPGSSGSPIMDRLREGGDKKKGAADVIGELRNRGLLQ